MAVRLIRVRQARRGKRIVKTNAQTLSVRKLDVLDDASRQISVGSINAGIQDGDRDTPSANRQAVVGLGQVAVAADAFNAGYISRRQIKIPLESAVAVNGSDGRQMRNCSEA